MHTPDGPAAPAGWQRHPGETPFQAAVRQDVERLADQLAGLPECVERTRLLGLLVKVKELAAVAAGRAV